MTDRELLELAAKAAGHEITGWQDSGLQVRGAGYWNPLTNDGDAFRLAVKLDIEVYQGYNNAPIVSAGYWVSGRGRHYSIELLGDEPYAATRRAIVRAAAEIGRRTQSEIGRHMK